MSIKEEEKMKKISNNELKSINGGGISASIITATVRAINSLLELGRSLGTAIRRIQNGSVCSL